MSNFLAENNICGQTMLQLVSRGNAIIAEIFRLKDYIPKIYKMDSKQDFQKYGDIILDFSYFKMEETQNCKIENTEGLQDLDQEFRDNHIEIINRFYLTFESIHAYITDLNNFLDELEQGNYIHETLDVIFLDMEGKQLMCESLYLYGLMLLLIDNYIDGTIRERLLVSYYRYTPQRSDNQSRIDEVCKLMRDTGKKNNYPEDYFKRIAIKQIYVDMVIGHLRSNDIYGQLAIYPLAKHKSCALSTQASILYICLFFSPNILHNQSAIMREIVDKYFPDNWIVPIYMGFTVNLIQVWDGFKAAKLALSNTLDTSNIKSLSQSFGSSLLFLLKTTNAKLKEGNNNEVVLKDINNIISLLRDCNYTIRWLMLHNNGRTVENRKIKQIYDLVTNESNYDQVQLFKLLLNTAQLELCTKEIYRNLLTEKLQQWTDLKNETMNCFNDLIKIFNDSNKNLQLWFMEISKQVDLLLREESGISSRKIVQLIQALEEVQEFHQLQANMQILQLLMTIRKNFDGMLQNLNINENILIKLQIISDLSYAWELIDDFTPIMQKGIKKEPTLVIKLRAIFLKLSSALEIPLLRINQAHSQDLLSVSQYYSNELECYVRKVLQIIPKMMFEKMSRIIEIQTNILKELPTRLDKDKLKDYSQLNERFEFAELTHGISVFSQGMRMMKSTLVGVVCLDPKELLQDGIRMELVQYISKALHSTLTFGTKGKSEDLQLKLDNLGQIMDGYKRSFDYIQDYININGLKIWQEEVTRIINLNVEQECNGFLRNKIHLWSSTYQSRHVPIPIYLPVDNSSVNFIGRLAREIIKLTDPRQSTYVNAMSSWYEPKSQKCIFNKETIASIVSAIEISGLVGMDRLFSFMIITNLQKIISFLEMKNDNNCWQNIFSSIQSDIKSNLSNNSLQNPIKFYQNCINRTTKIWTEQFLDCVLIVGQLQLLKNLIAFHLNKCCKFDAKNLQASLRTFNKALLLDINNEKCSTINEEFLLEISRYFDYSGLNNVFNKIYITSKYNEEYPLVIFMFVIAHLHKTAFLQQSVSRRNFGNQFDGIAFTVSVHTIIKQFHNKFSDNFIKLLSEYVLQLTKYNTEMKNMELPPQITFTLNFLDVFTNYSESARKSLKNHLPEEILHLEQNIMAPNT